MLRPLLALALASCGLACVSGRSYLIGCPKVEGKDTHETADLMHEVVKHTESRFIEVLDPKSGDPRSRWPTWMKQGVLKLLDQYVAMGNDEIGAQTGLDPQGTRSRREPLFLRPRISSPMLVEASRVSDDPNDARREWVIPVWLNRAALERPAWSSWILGDALSALFLPHPGYDLPLGGEELLEAIREKLNFV